MNETTLKQHLTPLNLGGLRYFETLGSTNDEALAWAARGAKDFSLVFADEQTQGRGRLARTWYTPKSSAIAMSLILHPTAPMLSHLSRTVGLAALSVADACLHLGLSPKIKWPNDILLNGKKAAGILVETVWSGAEADSMVIGIGINICSNAVPHTPLLKFPATSLEDELGNAPAREKVILAVLTQLAYWREHISSDSFLAAWEEKLAYQGQMVQILSTETNPVFGRVAGLESDGSLRLLDEQQNPIFVRYGDVSLRASA